ADAPARRRGVLPAAGDGRRDRRGPGRRDRVRPPDARLPGHGDGLRRRGARARLGPAATPRRRAVPELRDERRPGAPRGRLPAARAREAARPQAPLRPGEPVPGQLRHRPIRPRGGRRMTDYGHDLLFGTFVAPAAQQAHRIVELAKVADRAGLDLVTFQDHPYQAAFLDTSTLLAYTAAATERVRLSANVASLPLRPPAVLAR